MTYRRSVAVLASAIVFAPLAFGQDTCSANGSFDNNCLGAVCLGSWESDAFAANAQQQYQQICKDGLLECPGAGPCTQKDVASCCQEEDWELCFACFRDEACHSAESSLSFTLLPFQDPTGPVIIPKSKCTFGNMGDQVAVTASPSTDTTSTMSSPTTPTETPSPSGQPAATPTDSASPVSQGNMEPTSSGQGAGDTSAPAQSQATSTGAAGIMAERPRATAIGMILAAVGAGFL